MRKKTASACLLQAELLIIRGRRRRRHRAVILDILDASALIMQFGRVNTISDAGARL